MINTNTIKETPMSTDDLVAFLENLSQNEDLQRELRATAVGDGDDAAVSVDDLVDFAAAKGHRFSAEQVRSAFEVSDEELESVAGGTKPRNFLGQTKVAQGGVARFNKIAFNSLVGWSWGESIGAMRGKHTGPR
jgi:predicted ribosomally synthesized peptide with nif11-like leader